MIFEPNFLMSNSFRTVLLEKVATVAASPYIFDREAPPRTLGSLRK